MDFAGFVGPSYVTRLAQTSAEECINLFPETLESPNAKPQRILRRTPGLTVVMEGLHAPIRGQFSQDGRSFCVGGATLYETTSGLGVVLGTVLNDGKPVTFATNGSTAGAGGHQLLLASGGSLYLFDLNTNTFSLPASAAFMQGSVLTVVYMDTFFLAVTTVAVYQSSTEDGSSWNAANFGAMSVNTSNPVTAIANYPQKTFWIFGTLRTEVWYDNGAAVFSFAPIPGVFVNVGCPSGASVCRVNNTIAWLGQDETGTRIVYEANQYTPSRISTAAVEYDLGQMASVSDFVGYAYQEEGHTFYVLTSVANKRTWVYDVKEHMWHKRAYLDLPSGLSQQVRGWNHVVSPGGAHWVGDWSLGTIYAQSLNTYDDAGNPQRWLRRFPHLVQQQHRVFYPGFVLDAQKGVGLSSGQGSDPQVALRWSNDGGETWSTELWRSLGKVGAFGARTYWQKLGVGRNRVWELSGSDPVPLALTGVYLDPDPVVGAN